MIDENVRKVLSDYFDGKGIFDGSGEYFGMRGSQRHVVFIDYFVGLNASERDKLASCLTLVATGHSIEFEDQLPSALSLIFQLAISGYTASFLTFIGDFEREFNSTFNVENWLTASDSSEEINGIGWKRTWRYALLLYNILKLLKSTEINVTVDILRLNSTSEHFKNCLS